MNPGRTRTQASRHQQSGSSDPQHTPLLERRKPRPNQPLDLLKVLVHARPEVDGEHEVRHGPARVRSEEHGESIPVERVDAAEQGDVTYDGPDGCGCRPEGGEVQTARLTYALLKTRYGR